MLCIHSPSQLALDEQRFQIDQPKTSILHHTSIFFNQHPKILNTYSQGRSRSSSSCTLQRSSSSVMRLCLTFSRDASAFECGMTQIDKAWMRKKAFGINLATQKIHVESWVSTSQVDPCEGRWRSLPDRLESASKTRFVPCTCSHRRGKNSHVQSLITVLKVICHKRRQQELLLRISCLST